MIKKKQLNEDESDNNNNKDKIEKKISIINNKDNKINNDKNSDNSNNNKNKNNIENNNSNNNVNNSISNNINKKTKKNVININNININNQQKSNTKNTTYNINNYVCGDINNSLITSTCLNSLNHPFFNKNIINNNYNININSLRISYQKEGNRFTRARQKINAKKSFSTKVKSLKERYRNSINYYFNPVNKISLDYDEEDSIISDKESNRNNSIEYLSPQFGKKNKDAKILTLLPQTKEEIFSKAIRSILSNENMERRNSKNSNNSISKYRVNKIISSKNMTQLKNSIGEKKSKKGKRSSLLCPGLKFQIKNKKKHVTFTQQKSGKIDNNFTEKLKKMNNNNLNNIKRIKV